MLDADFNPWPEDLRSDEDLSSGFDEDLSEHSSSLEEGLSDAEESVNADDPASNDGDSSYISSEAAEESEDCDSPGEESSEGSISSGGQAGRQPDFLTPALSQVIKHVLSTCLHSSGMCRQAHWHHLSTSLCALCTSPKVLLRVLPFSHITLCRTNGNNAVMRCRLVANADICMLMANSFMTH